MCDALWLSGEGRAVGWRRGGLPRGKVDLSGHFEKVKILGFERRWDVAGLLAPLDFALEFLAHALLDLRAAGGVDRMGDVRMQLHAHWAVAIAELMVTLLVEAMPAIVAVAGAKVVLFAAVGAVVRELARGHGQEQ